jgi:hypothetical protein
MSYLNKQSTYLFSFVPYTKYFLLLVLAEKKLPLLSFLFFFSSYKKGLKKFLLPKKLPNFLYSYPIKKKWHDFFPTKLYVLVLVLLLNYCVLLNYYFINMFITL